MKRKADWTPEEEENLRKFPKLTNIVQKYILENSDNTAEVVASLPNNLISADTYLDFIVKDAYRTRNFVEPVDPIAKATEWFTINHNLTPEESTTFNNFLRFTNPRSRNIIPQSWDEWKNYMKTTMETNGPVLDKYQGDPFILYRSPNGPTARNILRTKQLAINDRQDVRASESQRKIASKLIETMPRPRTRGDFTYPIDSPFVDDFIDEGAQVHKDLYETE
jgi:hypothetical protein